MRLFEDFFEVPDHGKVGYTLSKRGDVYFVRFLSPKGLYKRLSTSMTEKSEARVEAGRMILRAYRPQEVDKLAPMTWDEAVQKLESAMTANGNRPATFISYATALRAIRRTLPDTNGPMDIGREEAQQFKDVYLGHGYSRTSRNGATVYERSKVSFNTYLRAARAIWHKWFMKLKIAKENPWNAVDFAKVDKKLPKAPDEGLVAEFFDYIKAIHPGWDLPILFIQTKCFLGCRLMDLCSVRSSQLENGTIELLTKTRDFRRVPLPKKLYAALDALKGPTYLWEPYNEQFRARKKAAGERIRRLAPQFSPHALYVFIANLFRKFQKATGKKLKSHMLRKRAVTLLFMEGVSVEVAAKMLGMDVQTLRRYYLDLEKLDAGKKFKDFEDTLMPPG